MKLHLPPPSLNRNGSRLRRDSGIVLVVRDGFELCRKHLAAMADEAFNPSSARFNRSWTPLTAPEVDHLQSMPLLESWGVSDGVASIKFMEVYSRLVSIAEEWNMFNLALLQNFPGLKTFKHELCQHWLDVARACATQRVSRLPAPLVLLCRSIQGGVVDCPGFSLDPTLLPFPADFSGELQNALHINDKHARSGAAVLRQLLLSAATLEWKLERKAMSNEVMQEAFRVDVEREELLSPLPSQEDIVRMAHVQLRLSCGLPVDVEGSLPQPLLAFTAKLLRWHLMVLRFTEQALVYEGNQSSPPEEGSLEHHLGAWMKKPKDPKARGVLIVVLDLPSSHALGDLCEKLSRKATEGALARFILCTEG